MENIKKWQVWFLFSVNFGSPEDMEDSVKVRGGRRVKLAISVQGS